MAPQKPAKKTVINKKDNISQETEDKSGILNFLNGKNAKWVFFTIYFIITVFLFRDFLFNGDMMLFGSDTIPDGVYTRQYYKDYHAENGGIPRWNPYVLGGLPFIDAMHGDTFYPGAWLSFAMPIHRALGHKLVWHVFLAGIFMYIFLRTLRLRRDAAFLGGLMYMLAPSFVTWLYGGHDAKMYVIAFLPLAFAFLESGMNKPAFWKFAMLGGIMGLLILTSHVQMAYYAYWAIGLYFIFRLFTSERNKTLIIKTISFFLVAVLIAVALGAVQLLPSYKFTTSLSVRSGEERTGYEYATSWSMHYEEAAGMIVSSFPGYIDGKLDSMKNLYWGKNPFKLNSEYNGIIPILFALMALFVCRGRLKWFLFGLALLSLIYSLGAETPFYRLFYALIPGIKNFRAPGMMIFIFCFSIVVMASMFISEILDKKPLTPVFRKRILYIAGAVFIAAVVISLMGKGFINLWEGIFRTEVSGDKAAALNENMLYFIKDLWLAVFTVGIALTSVWMFITKKMNQFVCVLILAFLIVIDESLVDNRFITVLNPAQFERLAPDNTVKELKEKIKNSAMPFRVLGMDASVLRMDAKYSSNYYAMFGIQVADGHHNNELKTYELFKGGRMLGNFLDGWLSQKGFKPEGIPSNNFLKVAGVKYIIFPDGKGGTILMPNEKALERAYIVNDCIAVNTDTLAVNLLKDVSFDPSRKVVITGGESLLNPDTSAVSTVESLKYVKNRVEIAGSFKTAGYLVLCENFVPYWKVSVDGSPVKIDKAYGTFMAVKCSGGKHNIVFEFKSSPYETGKKLTLASFVFILLTLALTGGYGALRNRKK